MANLAIDYIFFFTAHTFISSGLLSKRTSYSLQELIGLFYFQQRVNGVWKQGRKEVFYLMTNSTHF